MAVLKVVLKSGGRLWVGHWKREVNRVAGKTGRKNQAGGCDLVRLAMKENGRSRRLCFLDR